jgi:hypothetical protein
VEEAGLVEVEAAVTTTSGVYTDDGAVHSHLPWIPSSDIRNVGIGTTVLLHAKEQESYDWTLLPPLGSDTELIDATTRTPEFVPDIPGMYRAMVTDLGTNTSIDLFVFAGNFRGIIEGVDAEGKPIPESACLNCHTEGGVAANQFEPWIQTGHAEIFTQNFNSSAYWGPQCFSCHTVGYNPDVANSGIDDASDYQDFLNSGLLHNPDPLNWATMLALYPESARRANIQCENCHGPQDGEPGLFTAAHAAVLPRTSIAADSCAVCHGEPLRHARYQQWQLSAHANYEVAIDESESGSCSRCHTGNGFLAWLPILTGEEPGDPTASIPVTWTPDEAHPQTCVVCHDPHAIGDSSGTENNATVRISGNTPPLIAGFTAYGVGRGAICMTCHNSRRGQRDDTTFDTHYGTSEASRGPHGSAQADVLMGQNAYLVTTGVRGNHSFLTDSCTNCHMVQTPPPDQLAYNGGGTNHTFYASTTICAECHGDGFEAESIQMGVQDTLDILQLEIEDALVALFDEQIGLGNTIDLNGQASITDVGDIDEITFTEYRGRQAFSIVLNGAPYGPFRVNDVDVVAADLTVLGAIYDFADPALVKGGWNWGLVHNDGSLGIHNPTYSYDVLTAAIEALGGAMPLGPPDWLTP